jgi:hypothetical protein
MVRAAVAVFDAPQHHQHRQQQHQQQQQQQQQQQPGQGEQEEGGPERKRRRWDADQPSMAAGGGATPRLHSGSSAGTPGLPSPEVCELVRRALTVGFANRIARRMRLHNGYRTCNEAGALAQLHPASSQLAADGEGLLPEWLIYNEFVATSRPFLRQVRARCVRWKGWGAVACCWRLHGLRGNVVQTWRAALQC